jgi:hypothetical protein
MVSSFVRPPDMVFQALFIPSKKITVKIRKNTEDFIRQLKKLKASLKFLFVLMLCAKLSISVEIVPGVGYAPNIDDTVESHLNTVQVVNRLLKVMYTSYHWSRVSTGLNHQDINKFSTIILDQYVRVLRIQGYSK